MPSRYRDKVCRFPAPGLLVAGALGLLPGPSAADISLTVEVTSSGRPVEHAVAYLEPLEGPLPASPDNPRAVMDQKDKSFLPHVLPVVKGTSVSFPNSDNIRHHVYSFSPAKRFELRLYKGKNADPVRFERAGTVVLGCNIHDHMLGYILVLETPWFDRTGGDGRAGIDADGPPGPYRVTVWHPRMREPDRRVRRRVELDGQPRDETFELDLKPAKEREKGSPADDEKESIEDRFRRFGDDDT